MTEIKNAVVFVTGGSRGIGKALVGELAAEAAGIGGAGLGRDSGQLVPEGALGPLDEARHVGHVTGRLHGGVVERAAPDDVARRRLGRSEDREQPLGGRPVATG